MPSVIRVQYSLPDAQFLNQLLTDDLILRYVKDSFTLREQCDEFYDTEDWAATGAGFCLSATRSQEIPVAILHQGHLSNRHFPGLFHGWEWIAPFTGADYCVEALMERGAPEAFGKLLGGRKLTRCFYSISGSKSTTLYLPDRTRASMCFTNGEVVIEDKRSPSYTLCLELLFGEEALLLNYCEQLRERFSLAPVLLSRQQQALRLLRSR